MKHLYTFFVTLMTFGITVAQTNITFDESWVVNGESWTIKQDEGSTVTIEEADSNKYLQVVYEATGQEWQNAQIKPQYSMGHTYITVEAGNTLQFDVWADHTGDANQGAISGMVKIEKESNSSDNYEYSFTLNGDGQWQTVTIDLGVADKNGKEPNGEDYYLIVFFNNYGAGTYLNPDTRYYDNVIFDGTALPDPNAVETYTPNAPATAPTVDSSDVISIYSDTYTSAVAEFNNNPSWGQATSVAEESLFSNSFLKYTNLNYQGTEFTATDVDAKEYLHVDYYLGKSDITSVDFYLIGGGVEVAKALSVTSKGEWVSVDIDLADFDGVDLTAVNQFKVVGSGTVYFDNWYFHGTSSRTVVADPEPSAAAPDPTEDSTDVISVYSDSYTAVGSVNTNPAWGQSTAVSEIDLSGNSALKYKNLNYQGTTYASQDVSGKQYLHVDYWIGTSSTTSMNVYLIGGGAETAYALDVTAQEQWVSVDIDLSNFTAPDLTVVEQFKFDATDGTLVYIDNLYFHGTAPDPSTSVDMDFSDSADAAEWTPSHVDITATHQETGGNPGGALAFGYSDGGNHRLSYTNNNFDYTGATTARFTFDLLQTSSSLTGTAVHFRYSTSSTVDGTAAQDLDIQADGINTTTWTSFSYDETVSGDSDLAYMSINIAMGDFVGAEGSFLLDNVAVTLLDENGSTLSTYEIETPQQFITYPNPLQNTLNVRGTVDVDQVSIYDLMGRNVLNANPNKSEFSLDVSQLNKGVYMVQLKAGNKETTLKIVK